MPPAAPSHQSRDNNFGLLRLLFAALVIVSHAPELADGNRSREILTRLFGTLSFGEVAVDGFFLLSGYLVTNSYLGRATMIGYAIKRAARILPGYAVSFWLCVLVLGPLVGGRFHPDFTTMLRAQIWDFEGLLPPDLPGAFAGLPHPDLNGALWTILYEFRCYVLTIVLGLCGLFARRGRWVLAAIAGLLLLANAGLAGGVFSHGHVHGMSEPHIRFAALFLTGALFFLFRDRVRSTGLGALLAGALLVVLMFHAQTAEAAFAVLGGYLIFYGALHAPALRLGRFGAGIDISYGMYLYAWPIQNLILWHDRGINPWLLCGLTLPAAAAMGYASWRLVEQPALSFGHRLAASVAVGRPARRPTDDPNVLSNAAESGVSAAS